MKKQIPLSIICSVVANHFGCEPIDIFNNSRKRVIIRRRQWFHYLARILNPEYIVSSTDIGMYYSDVTGNPKDHATVLHSVKVIEGFVEYYEEYKKIENHLILRIRLASGVFEKNGHESIPIGYFCTPMVFKIPVLSKEYPINTILSA